MFNSTLRTKKTVVIFCRHFDQNKKPFKDPYYWNAYIDLLLAIKQAGAEAYFASDQKTYLGNGLFSVAYTADKKVPLGEFKIMNNIKADIVYDKGGFTGEGVPVLNPARVHKITSDKIETYNHFAEYQPPSLVCMNEKELLRAFDTLQGERLVVKAPKGNGGGKVYIGSRKKLLSTVPQVYPLLAQEFLDTSIGIAGFVEGIHDLRVKIGGGTIWGGTLRQPAKGEFRANVAQGGTERHLFPDEIPEAARQLAIEIDQYFKAYPRYIAIDFANTPAGLKLIELNSKPGLSPVASSHQSRHITETLAHYLVSPV